MAGKLTDLAVKSAKPADKRYTHFDTGGLYLEVAPNRRNGGDSCIGRDAGKKFYLWDRIRT
ncbi:MAG: Arm DNA-binding domain-containing protein [Desulfovibrio sp.]|nr:Arm DNA-binding domain-containing protein [Desulfovibrio sp.]